MTGRLYQRVLVALICAIIAVLACPAVWADDILIDGRTLVTPTTTFAVSSITAANPAVVSFECRDDGPECVSDTGFDDPSKWGTGTDWVISDGAMSTTDPNDSSAFYQNSSDMLEKLIVGRYYVVTYEVDENTLGTSFRASGEGALDEAISLPNSVGQHSVILECVRVTSSPVRFSVGNGTGTFTIGSLSIRRTDELWQRDAATFAGDSTYGWIPSGLNTIANVDGELQITYVNSSFGANVAFSEAADCISDLTIGDYYSISFDAYYSGGAAGAMVKIYGPPPFIHVYSGELTTTKTRYTLTFLAESKTIHKLQTSGMTPGNIVYIDNISLRLLHNFSVGDSIAFSVPLDQTVGPDIPRSFEVIQGAPTINGDTVSFEDEVGQVRHEVAGNQNYWAVGAKYLVNCTVENWSGVNGIYLPYTVTSPSSYHLIFGNGEYQYHYSPKTYDHMGMYSYAGHTADVTVNFIKEILPVNGTPYRVTAIDPGTGDVTIDADFSGLENPVTSGAAFGHRRNNFKQLSF